MAAEISEKEGRVEAPGAFLSTPVDNKVPEKAAKPEPKAQKSSVSDTAYQHLSGVSRDFELN